MLSFITGSVTQGSADAFAQGTITTGLQNVAGLAFRIRRIEFSIPGVVGADCSVQMNLGRKSLTAIPNLADHSVIKQVARVVEMTTSGMVIYDPIVSETYTKDEDLVIVEDPLYFQLDSAGTSASNTGLVRIGYESRKISEVERLALIAATLS